MNETAVNGKNNRSRVTEMKIGDTLFTVISVQSEHAKETAYEKVRKLIMNHASDVTENISLSSH